MEDIRLAASLFFEKNPGSKNAARAEFSTLREAKPGRVAKKAFGEHLQRCHPGCSTLNLASELDADRDGYLTFEDFLVCCYLFQTRPVCRQCKAIAKLVFYTCLQCFVEGKSKGPTYDLCPKCYRDRNKSSHPHNLFVDNYALANIIRIPPKDLPIEAKIGSSVAIGLTMDKLLSGSGN
ncbi:uncharacterized protein LOC115738101 [Rhodamnia argentea]|uniref:Uncharacterized protein LOC115738101 n=1 Tax=Rhodamnia argentea TaxID=178133 RepID=A0A8B8NVC0_9MYRT|nr:uncharacterized protein LOC115738101 [Rhodamnia argentea]